jgi:hypothetical protein
MTTIRKCSIVAWLLVAAVSSVTAQETYRLMSAQVVTRTDGPPSLRLAANGPIAFRVLPASETGEPVAPNTVKAKLYGIMPGELFASGVEPYAPYALVTQVDGQDTLLTVVAPSNLKIELRAAMKSNEIVVVATAAQP